ncbi:hypothetical protein Tsubulata_037535 [Turnera subulata]|uniref:ER membrane protein complex subunit 4 n=1 Tax=Turnera subulata TaxID=218843 RepID=A0A9Q0FPT0_9ROSI|nr:hypothetical protein Tsubulata_037535 [Turnera subulata]
MDKGKAVMGSGRRWAVDFTDNSTAPSSRDIPDPPGFSRASLDQDDSTVTKQKKDAEANWKAQKAWEVAQAPFKNLLMMGFMMWMAGNTVHLFSIGITFSALWQPISALQGVGKVFEPYKDNKVDLLGPKLLFIALNLGGLALGIWKLNTLGLLPTHASDWVSSLSPAQVCLIFPDEFNLQSSVLICSTITILCFGYSCVCKLVGTKGINGYQLKAENFT